METCSSLQSLSLNDFGSLNIQTIHQLQFAPFKDTLNCVNLVGVDKSSDILEAFYQSYHSIERICLDRWDPKNITVFFSVFNTFQLKDLQIDFSTINSELEEDDIEDYSKKPSLLQFMHCLMNNPNNYHLESLNLRFRCAVGNSESLAF